MAKQAKPLNKETDRHRDAYQFFVDLGPDRTFVAVAKKFGVSHTTVRKWARSFHWKRRSDEHDARIARRTIDLAEKEGVELTAQARVRNLKLVELGLVQLARALAGGHVKMQLSDLSRLVTLEQLLKDGPPDGKGGTGATSEPNVDDLSTEEQWNLIVEEVEALNRITEHDNYVRGLIAERKIQPLPGLMMPARLCAKCGATMDAKPTPEAAVSQLD